MPLKKNHEHPKGSFLRLIQYKRYSQDLRKKKLKSNKKYFLKRVLLKKIITHMNILFTITILLNVFLYLLKMNDY